MYEGFNIWGFLGLPMGIAIAAVILFFSWRKGRKERRFDERYTSVHQQAKSISWGVTTVAILVGWMIVIIMEGPGLSFFLMSGIWVVHMGAYGIGTVIAERKN